MNENSNTYSATGEIGNILQRRTKIERLKIALSKAPLSAWFGMIVLFIYLFTALFAPFIAQGIGQWSGNTINGALPNPNVALAYLFKAEQGEPRSPLETMKPRLFYYSGTPIDITGENPNTGNNFDFHIYSSQFLQTIDATTTNNKFPLCLQYNLDTLGSVTADTKLLNWTWYSPNFNTGFTFNYFGMTYSEHGFYNDYWSQYINEIYSDEARIMECYLNLDPVVDML